MRARLQAEDRVLVAKLRRRVSSAAIEWARMGRMGTNDEIGELADVAAPVSEEEKAAR